MPENLRTVYNVEVVYGLDQGKGGSFSTSCLLTKTDQCPKKSIMGPRCGKCDFALADQTAIQAKATETGFNIASSPKKYNFLGSSESYGVVGKDDIFLEVRHKNGKVEFSASDKS